MASKRTATSELNHNNWNEEDDPEEAGSFAKASEDIIKNRVIKVAKRRNPIGSLAASEGEKKPGAFANFGGFVKPSSTSAAVSSTQSPFGFLSNITSKSEEHPKTNGLNTLGTTSNSKTLSSAGTCQTLTNKPSTTTSQDDTEKIQCQNTKEYYARLKGLNESFAKWVSQHVDTNPFINLNPVLKDYEKYMNELESSKEGKEKTKTLITTSSKVETQKKEISTFTFKPDEDKLENKTSVFTNVKTTKVVETDEDANKQSGAAAPKFNFGTGFSFGGSSLKPFTFSNVAGPVGSEEKKEGNEEDEEEPPKVEFKAVIEEGHIYTVRCKLFVKKDGKFSDRGVGNLYLKPVPDSDKVQLIVRADTSLGNLLCNLILSTNIPMQRMGNKDVMLVCIPTPDSKPPPVPVLFRVKSSDEADELLRTLEKHKK